jgi:transposase
MSAATYWVGLDVGEDRTRLCVVDASGSPLREIDCESLPQDIVASLDGFPKDAILQMGMEAGCGTHLARKLRHLGYPVSVLETRKTKRLLEIRANKSDTNDARGIADIIRLRAGSEAEVFVKSLDTQHLRTRLRLRHGLVKHRVAAEGFIRSLLRLHGGRLGSINKNTPVRVRAETEMERLWIEEGIDLFDEVSPLIALSEGLRAHLKAADAWLVQAVNANPICGRFLGIPGVGPVCALSFYSAIEDPARFDRTANVSAYLGLTPRLYQSGNARRMFGITRMGNKLTRSHLVMAAMSVLRARKPSALQEWGLAVSARAGRGKARVAVARKLATIMLSMWKSGTAFDPQRGSHRAPTD